MNLRRFENLFSFEVMGESLTYLIYFIHNHTSHAHIFIQVQQFISI